MKRLAIAAALVILPLAGCTIKQEPPEATDASPSATDASPSATDAPPSETEDVIAEQPPADAARPATAAEYSRALDYFEGYCWSDCSQAFHDRWEYHYDRASAPDVRAIMVALASLSYREVDQACDEFWDSSDETVVGYFPGYDTSAVLTAFYFVCDT